jgi:hypothetical protein
MSSGPILSRSSPPTRVPVGLGYTPCAKSSRLSSTSFAAGVLGAYFPTTFLPGRPYITTSDDGASMALGSDSTQLCVNACEYGWEDSQSAKTTGVGGEARGYDGGKKVRGRKRHLLVDTEGLVLKAKVHCAKVPDQDGIKLLLKVRRLVSS